MSEFDIAWTAYAGASLVLIAGAAWLVRGWWGWLRDLSVLLLIVVLAVPAPVEGYPGQFAPAALVGPFEAIFQSDGNPAPAFAALATGAIIALLLTLILFVARLLLRRRSAE